MAWFRVSTIFVPSIRESILRSKVRGKDHDLCVKYALAGCNVGDWFLLNQIRKNVNPYFFRELIEKLGSPNTADRFG